MDTMQKPKKTAAERRKRTTRFHAVLRFVVQVAFFVLAPGLFSAAFNGVKYAFTQIGSFEAIEATSFVVLLCALLAFTFVFGRFFCGYACAFGTLGDVVYALSRAIFAKTPLARLRLPDTAVRVLSLGKYIVLVGICLACLLGVGSVVSSFSPWVAFAGITSGNVADIDNWAFVVLALCVLGMIVQERFFCLFLCPMGAVFSFVPVLGVSILKRDSSRCPAHCGQCKTACPARIWPGEGTLESGECLSCGRCADVCPMGNVNLLAREKQEGRRDRDQQVRMHLAKKGVTAQIEGSAQAAEQFKEAYAQADAALPCKPKTRRTWWYFRGNGVVPVLLKALLLLVLCWLLGNVRYLPQPAEVAVLLAPIA